MSVAEQFLEPVIAQPPDADCVAFVADNQTLETINHVAAQFFKTPSVRDGGSSQALEYLSSGAQPPKVLIVDIGDTEDPLSTMLSLTTALTEETQLIGIGAINDIALYREVTEAGVLDYLVKPISERMLASAFARAEEVPTDSHGGGENKQRVAVIGTRGGAGASTIAVNLAWVVAEDLKRKAILVDLDIWWGTIALSLDLEPTHGLREALENPARIDSLFISSSTAKVTERLSVMAAEEPLTSEMLYYTGATEILIESLGHSNDCVILDLPRSAFRMRHPVLEAATQILIVTPLNLPGLRDSIRFLGAIDETQTSAKIRFVANRVGSGQQGMEVSDFNKALGRKVDFLVPDEPKIFNTAANTGRPAIHDAPRSKAAKILKKIAEGIPFETADETKAKAGFFQKLRRKG
ncbi:MAG: hypothetical protein MI920_27350 [Kiloniellales bacterium]|nr:hypothetical protein [Kiloniellales bacterium]